MPKTCCSCHDDREEYPIANDTCMCGGAYLNGWVAIVGVQLLALAGMLFSIAALGDCSFMELENRLFFPEDLDVNLPLKVTQTQYVGFLTWQMLDGSCYFYFSGSDPVGQISEFYDILGRDWEMARFVAMLSACLSFIFFCYLLSFTCSSQVRGVRYFNTIFLSVILTGLQGVTFLSFDSSFCEEYGCVFSRSAGFSVASMACFFLSGLCFCCTMDYPGPRWSDKMPKMISVAQVAPEQSRGYDQSRSVESASKQEDIPDYEEELVEDQEEVEVFDDEEQEEVFFDPRDDMIEEETVEDEDDVVSGEFDSTNEPHYDEASDGNTEVTDDEVADGSQTGTKTDDSNGNESDDDHEEFTDHSRLEAGENCEVFTEVTEEDVRTVETITHTDGTQTVTETHKESTDENRAEV